MSHAVCTTMVDVNCAECGMLFSVTSDFRDRRQQDHEYFYCPKKHSNYWPQKTDLEIAKQETKSYQEKYNRERMEREYHETESKHLRRSRGAIKGMATKMKNRIANGVCPCCNRQFKNLHRHMKGQHPDFKVGV